MRFYRGETVYVLTGNELQFCRDYLPKKAAVITDMLEDGMECYFGRKTCVLDMRTAPDGTEEYRIGADGGARWWNAALLRLQ